MNNLSIGTWISLPNESIAEIFAKAGYKWIVIDLEHSSITIDQAANLIRVIDLSGAKPYVRLSAHDSAQIKRVLDAGARGIIAPMIENANQMRDIINACHYPPTGKRGMGLARAQAYGEAEAKTKYINQGYKDVEIFAQIESLEAVKNIESIFAESIDGYFIGPYDLSASMGNAGKFNTEEFKQAEFSILEAAKKANIKSGFHLVEPVKEELVKLFDFGYDMVAFSVDIRMLDSSARIPFK